jgi:hypothetical protein
LTDARPFRGVAQGYDARSDAPAEASPLRRNVARPQEDDMTEGNPVTGHPFGGKEPPEDAGIPGEEPLPEDEQTRKAPETGDSDDETASRAAEEQVMSDKEGVAEATPGVAQPVSPPSPADATDADPPGGSAANQRGRVPDE